MGHGRIGSGRRERKGGGKSGRGRSGSWEEVGEGVIRRKRYQKESKSRRVREQKR